MIMIISKLCQRTEKVIELKDDSDIKHSQRPWNNPKEPEGMVDLEPLIG